MADTYKLQYPIKGVGGREIESVPIRRLKAKDMVAAERAAGADAGDTERAVHMLARMTGLDFKEEVQELDLDDLNALSEILGKSGGSQAGEKTEQG